MKITVELTQGQLFTLRQALLESQKTHPVQSQRKESATLLDVLNAAEYSSWEVSQNAWEMSHTKAALLAKHEG